MRHLHHPAAVGHDLDGGKLPQIPDSGLQWHINQPL
jgi:hypothetical protein